MKTAKTNNQLTAGVVCLIVGMLVVALAAPAGAEGVFADALDPAVGFGTGLGALQQSPAPPSSFEPALPDLEALRDEVKRLQVLVARLQLAISVLQEPEFDLAATPTLLEPLADLRDLFPDIAYRLCRVVSPLGRGHMPDRGLDAVRVPLFRRLGDGAQMLSAWYTARGLTYLRRTAILMVWPTG
jgi:hypothetical protein